MLPAVITREIEEGIKSFLRSTFPPSTPAFEETLETFLSEPGRVFKGPYYGLRLPFRPAPPGRLPFEGIRFPYPPYLHQACAFDRLCSDPPQSTLVATGTGSGKTDCFLYPILNACAGRIGELGIKAIVIYPMNALATDQARRFAKALYADPALKDKVTVGLYIGGVGDETVAMTSDNVITNKAHIREHPTDILLTNYKMLDFLLLRPDVQNLWRDNGAETLRFLVVDELHTFDGAQSTDLACLVRRLKARLRTPEKHLCCIGTSATLGSTGSVEPLLSYARTVFAEPFADDCVIGETLLTLNEVVDGSFIRYHGVPDVDAPNLSSAEAKGRSEAYLAAQYRLWFGEEAPEPFTEEASRISLGAALREHSLFRNLLLLIERSGRKAVSEEWLIHELGRMVSDFSDGVSAKRLLDSFLSLCAHARFRDPVTGTVSPLVRVHIHLWTRELSRLVASVGAHPRMAFSDDLKGDALKGHLPVVHCRECGAMGWGGSMRVNDEKVSANLQEFYKAFFGHLPSLRFLFPVQWRDEDVPRQGEFSHRVCGHCLTVNATDAASCRSCGQADRLVEVLVHDRTRRRQDQTEADISCPYCESASGLTILGSRSASLTSVALSQIFTSPFNPDKKALAFSDNVQDASHRSGFFSARTYRVNLRTAIRKVIADADRELTLAELEPRFLDFWKGALGDLDFTGLFLPPNMEWLDDYESLRQTGKLPAGSGLVGLVARRTGWEITGEFGFGSRIGRTLEKSGAAVAYPDPQAVERVVVQACHNLKERAGGFGTVSTPEVISLMLGLLHRLRTGGGIIHPELDSYIESGGNTYLLNQKNHMPHFGPTARAPTFFYQGGGRFQRFERLVAGGTSVSWSQRWVIKTLRSVPGLSADSAGIVIEEAIKAFCEQGILDERKVQDSRVWGINRDRLRVTPEVRLMTCRYCGHSMSYAPAEQPLWENAPCLRPTCGGFYALQPPIQDYFGDLYRSGDVVRIRTAEHTGLLDRDVREWTEKRFMARDKDRRTTDPNLLSCTPTLEMGVDIGDLSTVVLCAVPPATSNYVQRVGRAGRKEGTAVSLTIASAQPHDLYYFELPEDMIAGEIRPPGTFLNAPAVLERQLTAFCLDRWSEQINPVPVLPSRIDAVLDVVRDPGGKTGFPYNFFTFVQANLDALLGGFLGLFVEEDLTPESRTTLDGFARGDGSGMGDLTHKILTKLTALAEERKDLLKRMQKVGAAIRRNRDIVARDEALDAELDELKQHRDGIYGMLKQINGKLTLNFFTDEGLLPNYAFPEEGVELRSVILKKREKPKGEEGKYQALSFEYMRPASSAITELAPGNVFYVEGRRLRIDQVGLNVSPIEVWHFCDACGYMEAISVAMTGRSECPACGSPNWTDSSLKRDLVRLRQVVSTSADRTSRSHDEKEQRDPVFYNRHESVVIPEDAERQAYQIRGSTVPFGFEFLGKSTLRVVNLGQENDTTQSFRLGGREISTGGFVLCPDCGKVQTCRSGRGEEEMRHDLSCRFRGKPEAAPLRAVFLYRELTSEAIRVLLPSTSADEEGDLTSFVAALHLGLRLHFRGNIEHLHGCVDERPVPGTGLRRKYLVLYDQVPGGTGYLKQLSQTPEVFLNVLRLALQHLTACECASREDHDTDGCHRCILQSRHRRDHAGLSRTAAIRLLTAILEHADKLEQVERVSDIDIHPLIKSALEKAFLESLRAVPGALLQAKIIRGKPGYLWRRGDTAWEIGLQVPVPVSPGVDTPSIPDFVFYPIRPAVSRPVAVFVDGFAFHADESTGHNRVALDVLQRQALLRSGSYWTWSFSWEDIQYRNEPGKIPLTLFGEEQAKKRNEQLASQVFSGEDLALARSVGEYTSWRLFLEFLARPAEKFWQRLAYLYGLAMPLQLRPSKRDALTDLVGQIADFATPFPPLPEGGGGDGLAGAYRHPSLQVAGLTVSSQAGVRDRDPDEVFLLLVFDDDSACREPDFPKHWRGFLRLLNRLQFLPGFMVLTARGRKQGMFSGIADAYAYFLAGGSPRAVTPPSVGAAPEMGGDITLAHPAIRPLLHQLLALGVSAPVLGYEHMDGGVIVATVEAAWLDRKIALAEETMIEDCESLRRAEWTVLTFPSSGLTPEATEAAIAAIRGQT
jgi:DEAD/DEAH box helicase domain-containing protein